MLSQKLQSFSYFQSFIKQVNLGQSTDAKKTKETLSALNNLLEKAIKTGQQLVETLSEKQQCSGYAQIKENFLKQRKVQAELAEIPCVEVSGLAAIEPYILGQSLVSLDLISSELESKRLANELQAHEIYTALVVVKEIVDKLEFNFERYLCDIEESVVALKSLVNSLFFQQSLIALYQEYLHDEQ